jgi:hypothetical protein
VRLPARPGLAQAAALATLARPYGLINRLRIYKFAKQKGFQPGPDSGIILTECYVDPPVLVSGAAFNNPKHCQDTFR